MIFRARACGNDGAAKLPTAKESAEMADISIAADAVQTRAAQRPLIEKFLVLLSRLSAAWQARRLAIVDRIRRLGLTHID